MLCVLALALAGCGGDDDSGGATSAKKKPSSSSGTAKAGGQGVCKDVEQPTPRDGGGQQKPKQLLDPSKAYTVVLRTSCGSFTIRLDQRTSPNAAASFASLARNGFFDDTIFHRIVPGFVIQGGDPTATGRGGPGYSVRDVPPRNSLYTEGVVAMAKSTAEPPGTSGSQFFVVTGVNAGLPPEYAILGVVTKGLRVVRKIGRLGNPVTEKPTRRVVVLRMVVTP